MALEGEQMRTSRAPKAVFLAFGTQGDVYPLAALAAAMRKIKHHYCVTFITHSAHEKMCKALASSGVTFIPISTPPVLTASGSEGMVLDMRGIEVVGHHQQQYGGNHGQEGSCASSFEWKKKIEQLHREECFNAMERVFSSGSNNIGDFIAINFFALEGWHLAEMYSVPCVVAAPYVVPYSAPASFERQLHAVYPLLYKRLRQALPGEVGWNDVMHWMWPLFTDRWTEWRLEQLHLSACPLTDPITELPVAHCWPSEPLLLYGFSKEVVECPSYWPPSVHVCGFWFPPQEWETLDDTCSQTRGNKATGEQGYDTCSQTCGNKSTGEQGFSSTEELHYCPPLGLLEFLAGSTESCGSPIFIGLSSIGSMGFLDNPEGMLCILKLALEAAGKRGILFTAAYAPLDAAVLAAASEGGMDAETPLTSSTAVSCKSSNGEKKN